jgi:hypothetical protein
MIPLVKSLILSLRSRLMGFFGAEASQIRQGIMLSRTQKTLVTSDLTESEFGVFSQFGEDGIIQYLLQFVPIKNKTFIEFGVEDFFESNCRFLMMKDNWRGFVVDGSKTNIKRLSKSYFYWMYDLQAKQSFITKENVNTILGESGFDSDLGILSIDIDGVDYFVWDAINFYKPRILIMEYNANLGGERKITIPYRADFQRTKAHSSNLLWGSSLAALDHLSRKKGYGLVGVNSSGNNAFFVREDLITDPLTQLDAMEAFKPSLYRESRDPKGKLSFVAYKDRTHVLKGASVFNVETGKIETL